MKFLGLFVWTLIFCATNVIAQNPVSTKDWTPWADLEENWAEFYVITNFRGGDKSPEQLAKKELKSLKVECSIMGRVFGALPPALKGVKNIRIMFTEYGKYETLEGNRQDFMEVPYSGDKEQYFRQVSIIRPASQFDVEQASKPKSEVEVKTKVPNILTQLGVDPVMNAKVSGRKYRVGFEWRRKGSTVELKIKDYRLISAKENSSNP